MFWISTNHSEGSSKTVCEDEGFLLPSPVADESLSSAKALQPWIEENISLEFYALFCSSMVKSISHLN